nr:hypothetical protein [uncultured Porphyromonas sp.]
MLLHTGRSGLRPSDLCLFKRDLCRGPFPNNSLMNDTQTFLMRNPCRDEWLVRRREPPSVGIQEHFMLTFLFWHQ